MQNPPDGGFGDFGGFMGIIGGFMGVKWQILNKKWHILAFLIVYDENRTLEIFGKFDNCKIRQVAILGDFGGFMGVKLWFLD